MGTPLQRRNFLKVSSAAAWLGASGCLTTPMKTSKITEKPNIVLILTDDQGYQDLGCYGARDIDTPNIDRLADEGVKFTHFYVTAPKCTPTRSSIMTGCYPIRVGLGSGVLFPNNDYGLHPDEITVAEVLKRQGYATACIGKWHLGHKSPCLPTDQGFDEYFGIPYSNDMKGEEGVPLMRDKKIIEQPVDQETLTQRYTEEAIKFITRNADRRFFLYLPHTFPHLPWHVSEKFQGKSERGVYGDMIEEIDWSTGRIMLTLESLGLRENTLVIFTSDNGPAKRESGGSAAPLRGWKGQTYEGGMRVPCIMSWKGTLPEGETCDELATVMDFMPTFAHLAGSQEPQDRVIDGHNITPLMAGSGAKTPYEAFFYYNSHWVPGSPNRIEAVRKGPWKYHYPIEEAENVPGKQEALYRLDEDIHESNNLIDQHPEIAKELEELGEKHFHELQENQRSVKHFG